MVECPLDKCISQQMEPSKASFRNFLACVLRSIIDRVIIIDNGQQFTWVAYAEVHDTGKLREVSSYIRDCLSKIKDSPLGSFINGLRVLDMSDQYLLLFDKEIVAIKVSLAS